MVILKLKTNIGEHKLTNGILNIYGKEKYTVRVKVKKLIENQLNIKINKIMKLIGVSKYDIISSKK